MTYRTTCEPAGKSGRGPGRPPLDKAHRGRILEATAAVFLEKGFQRANTSEIAHRARTSKQTLYSLFPTKADLFVGVISEHTNGLFARHLEFLQSDRPTGETLNEMGILILRMFTASDFLALYRIVVAEAPRFPGLARQLSCACTERGYSLLATYLRSRHIGTPNYRKSAVQFVSFVLGDFLINGMLNPDRKWSERMLKARVREAVNSFLRLHSERPIRK